ncbi:MAG: GNAT family protein, partial [Patescibacteria group bacterium]
GWPCHFRCFHRGKRYQECGYGTEAAKLMLDFGFNQLNLHRIDSSALDFNKRSINMHLKLGFKKEGCRRQKIFKNGLYHDEVLFGLLREEWKK